LNNHLASAIKMAITIIKKRARLKEHRGSKESFAVLLLSFGLLALFFTTVPSSSFAWTNPFSNKTSQGNKLYAQGKYEQALQKYLDAQIDHPDSEVLHFNIGNILFKQQKYQQAEEEYRKASESKDRLIQAKAHYNLGNCKFRQNDFASAAQQYQKALTLDPNDQDAKFNLELAKKKLNEMAKNRTEQKEQENQKEKQGQKGQQKQNDKEQGQQKQPDQATAASGSQDNRGQKSAQKDPNQSPQKDQNQSPLNHNQSPLNQAENLQGQDKSQQPQPQPQEGKDSAPGGGLNAEKQAQEGASSGRMSQKEALMILQPLNEREKAALRQLWLMQQQRQQSERQSEVEYDW